jgi:hypothetical protein
VDAGTFFIVSITNRTETGEEGSGQKEASIQALEAGKCYWQVTCVAY